MFVTLDGIDGAGKSSLLDRLEKWLLGQALPVVRVRDPGTTLAGEAIRRLLLEEDLQLHRRCETLLYMAARCQLVEQRIRPALAAGDWVLSDRYLLANVAYQSVGGTLGADEIWRLGEIATGGLAPDLTLLLDLPASVALRRLRRPMDQMESRGAEYLEAVRQVFLQQLPRSGTETAVIDASVAPELVWQQVEEVLQRYVAVAKERAS